MYLKRLRLTNVKVLADQELSFTNPDGTPRLWTVLIGDNGLGKTTLLQAIALAAAGDRLARALVEDARDWVRRSDEERNTELEAEFATEGGRLPEALRIRLGVEPGSHEFEGSEHAAQLNAVRRHREPGFFVAGYGVERRLARPGEVAVARDPIADRLLGLFDGSHKMLGLEFGQALRVPHLAAAFYRSVARVFDSTDPFGHRLLPALRSLRPPAEGESDAVGGERLAARLELGGGKLILPPTLLSQGYQSMMAWIGDLIGQAMVEHGKPVRAHQLKGLVLIDEIALHLHPSWQRRCIPILKQAFPKLQFVVTSHSPLVLTGFEQHEIVRLHVEDDLVVGEQPQRAAAALSASQLMTSFFDVPVAWRPETEEAQRRYLRLKVRSDLTEPERAELERLEARLRPYVQASLHDPQLSTTPDGDLIARIDALEARLEALDEE